MIKNSEGRLNIKPWQTWVGNDKSGAKLKYHQQHSSMKINHHALLLIVCKLKYSWTRIIYNEYVISNKDSYKLNKLDTDFTTFTHSWNNKQLKSLANSITCRLFHSFIIHCYIWLDLNISTKIITATKTHPSFATWYLIYIKQIYLSRTML